MISINDVNIENASRFTVTNPPTVSNRDHSNWRFEHLESSEEAPWIQLPAKVKDDTGQVEEATLYISLSSETQEHVLWRQSKNPYDDLDRIHFVLEKLPDSDKSYVVIGSTGPKGEIALEEVGVVKPIP